MIEEWINLFFSLVRTYQYPSLIMLSAINPLLLVLWESSIINFNTLKFTLLLLTLWVFYYIPIFNLISIFSFFSFLCFTLMIRVLRFFLRFNSLTFYVFFEIRLIPTLLIVLLYGYQPEKLTATIYLLIYTVRSSLPLLLLIINRNKYLMFIDHRWRLWYSLMIRIGFIVKTPMFLVHVWLPKAHVEAPVAGSIVLAGVLLKLGSYGIIIFLPRLQGEVMTLYLSLRILGSLLCRIVCLRNWDIKGLIAYSSVIHIGVVTVGVVCGLEISYICALLIVIAHGVCSPILFSLRYLLYSYSHRRVLINNKGCLGNPIIRLCLFILLSVNMGVPPTVNLWREVIIFACMLYFMKLRVCALILIALLGASYNLFIYVAISQRKESSSLSTNSLYWPFLSSFVISFSLFLFISVF